MTGLDHTLIRDRQSDLKPAKEQEKIVREKFIDELDEQCKVVK